jgi:uncharacterized protein YuzE
VIAVKMAIDTLLVLLEDGESVGAVVEAGDDILCVIDKKR